MSMPYHVNGITREACLSRVLLFSIRPIWVEDIIAGRKLFELRRRPPNLIKSTPALLYETLPKCQIRAVCVMEPAVSDVPERLWDRVGEKTCVTRYEFDAYFFSKEFAHAIPICDVRELRQPLALEDLRKEIGFAPPQGWNWANEKLLKIVGAIK